MTTTNYPYNFNLRAGLDDDLKAELDKEPGRKRSEVVRQALRQYYGLSQPTTPAQATPAASLDPATLRAVVDAALAQFFAGREIHLNGHQPPTEAPADLSSLFGDNLFGE